MTKKSDKNFRITLLKLAEKLISLIDFQYPKSDYGYLYLSHHYLQELASFSYQLLNLTEVTSKKRNSREDFY